MVRLDLVAVACSFCNNFIIITLIIIIISGVFTSFDGGLSTPPKPYDLKNVKVPVLLLYGENDQLTHKSVSLHYVKHCQWDTTRQPYRELVDK